MPRFGGERGSPVGGIPLNQVRIYAALCFEESSCPLCSPPLSSVLLVMLCCRPFFPLPFSAPRFPHPFWLAPLPYDTSPNYAAGPQNFSAGLTAKRVLGFIPVDWGGRPTVALISFAHPPLLFPFHLFTAMIAIFYYIATWLSCYYHYCLLLLPVSWLSSWCAWLGCLLFPSLPLSRPGSVSRLLCQWLAVDASRRDRQNRKRKERKCTAQGSKRTARGKVATRASCSRLVSAGPGLSHGFICPVYFSFGHPLVLTPCSSLMTLV